MEVKWKISMQGKTKILDFQFVTTNQPEELFFNPYQLSNHVLKDGVMEINYKSDNLHRFQLREYYLS